MLGPQPVLLWFRNDLRLTDHAALLAALETGQPVLPVYVLDDESAGCWAMGGASRWWLHYSLAALAKDLRRRGATLVLRRGRAPLEIARLAQETGATRVFTGVMPEPHARAADQATAAALKQRGGELHPYHTTMLFRPDAIRTNSGGAFSIYSAFARACLMLGDPPPPATAPEHIPCPATPASDTLDDWQLLPTRPDWTGGLRATWAPGETGAENRLNAFLRGHAEKYAIRRDYPGTDGTSRLSPHLHFGEISAAQLWHAAQRHMSSQPRASFLRELLWREFAMHLLWDNPQLPVTPLRPQFAAMPWRDDAKSLSAWQRGRTGIPIVDAGMRQLWETGWMHNRVRMIVASFLVKHLLIRWQQGEAWFWDTLVDADLANNSASWQWVAGCGTDAAPYFRIFNPVLQGRKFDPEGAYVRHFVPELARLQSHDIHAPWEAPPLALADSGVTLGGNYPRPITDLTMARRRALDALAAMRAATRPGSRAIG
ncbi:MAG: deoxyribodipyrimidine photo-lyase [Acetobacteraceae bacterium]|nr:deoxyribodipyrimidine photo-lyase [Acetobacteraceae bacterium]